MNHAPIAAFAATDFTHSTNSADPGHTTTPSTPSSPTSRHPQSPVTSPAVAQRPGGRRKWVTVLAVAWMALGLHLASAFLYYGPPSWRSGVSQALSGVASAALPPGLWGGAAPQAQRPAPLLAALASVGAAPIASAHAEDIATATTLPTEAPPPKADPAPPAAPPVFAEPAIEDALAVLSLGPLQPEAPPTLASAAMAATAATAATSPAAAAVLASAGRPARTAPGCPPALLALGLCDAATRAGSL